MLFDVVKAGSSEDGVTEETTVDEATVDEASVDDATELPGVDEVAPPHAAKITAKPASKLPLDKCMFIVYLLMNSYIHILRDAFVKLIKDVLSFVNVYLEALC